MMENLPIDTSHPAVRDYLALIRCVENFMFFLSRLVTYFRGLLIRTRLQVLTPLSLLINIATVIVCTTVLTPGISVLSN